MTRRCSCLAVLAALLLMTGVASSRTYNTPTQNGRIQITDEDWDADELVFDDPADDCRYGTDTDLDDLYVTWDADNLYIGFSTDGGPGEYGDGYVIFLDTDAQAGITGAIDFTNADFYARRVRFPTMGADVVIGGWDNGEVVDFGVKHCTDPTATVLIEGVTSSWNPGWRDGELGIPWDGIYGLGAGVVPSGTTIRVIAVVVGGDGSGAYDAIPTTTSGVESNPGTPWDAYTDLDLFIELPVDANFDGAPDEGYPPSGAISGVVTLDDPGDTETVATVTAYVGENAVASAATAPGGGAYVIGRLADGTYDVRAAAASYLPGTTVGVEVIDGGATENVDFTLELVTGRIEGDVALVGGPATDVTVTIRDVDTGDAAGDGPFVVEGGTGPFSIGTVIDGTYDVEAQALGFVEASAIATVTDGGTTQAGALELPVVVATKYSFVDESGATIFGTSTTVSLPADTIHYFAEAWVEPRGDGDRVAYWDAAAQDGVWLTATRLDPAYDPQGHVVFADADSTAHVR